MRKIFSRTACIARLLLLATAAATCTQAAASIRILVDASTAMPMAKIEGLRVTGGIHRDLGIEMARELGEPAQFVVMPRKRIPVALARGDGDLACHFLPEWLPGDFGWTEPFMPNALLLLTDSRVAPIDNLQALRGKPIGTVLGFVYPDIERELGTGFIRDDAADASHNLLKFAAGRSRHMLTGEVFLLYQQRINGMVLRARAPMVVRRYKAACAVSRKSRHSVAEINRVIRLLQNNHRLADIYDKYR